MRLLRPQGFILNLAKRVTCGFAGAAFLGFLAMLALHHNGSIERDTLIDSSPQTVWTVLTATDDYPLWNPEISRLQGQLREGSVIEFVEGRGLPDCRQFMNVLGAILAPCVELWRRLSRCNHLDLDAIGILAIECIVFGAACEWMPVFIQYSKIFRPCPKRNFIDLLAGRCTERQMIKANTSAIVAGCR
jgi:hypothetical protein